MALVDVIDFFNLKRFFENADQDPIKSPLSIAMGNNRCVEIILNYMSKIKADASKKLMHVLPKLTDYKNFLIYFEKLPLQT